MNDELNLEELTANHPCVDLVTRWIHDEWGKGIPQEFPDTRRDLLIQPDCPSTFIALKNNQPVGLIGFRRYLVPEISEECLWLNILYIEQQHRRQGIASRMIQEAEERASKFDSQMFVYTAFPQLYEKLGWTKFRTANEEGSLVLLRKLRES